MPSALNASLVVIDQEKTQANLAEVVHIIGSVKDKDVLIVDDLIDTAGTFVGAIDALKKEGAQKYLWSCYTSTIFGSGNRKNSQFTNNKFVGFRYNKFQTW
ncbi:MAG: hypothetical protein MZV64_12160 [Ignavibacteriales bacterium]|nr:hypothetical protein [Ignavibacteriales bacterium]